MLYQILRGDILRLNQNDNRIFQTLSASAKPMSAYDLLDALRGDTAAAIKAPVQVYRSLEKLVEAGDVHRVSALNAFVACSCAHKGSPPGFLVCTSCGMVSEFDAGGAARVPRKRASGFAVQSMNVELSGLCKKCQTKELQK